MGYNSNFNDYDEYDYYDAEGRRRRNVPWKVVGGIAGILLLFSIAFWIFRPTERQDGSPLSLFSRSTPTPTPQPTIDPQVAAQILVDSAKQWTNRQTIGIDCALTVCNQRVALDLTFFHKDLLEAIVLNELANQAPTEFNQELASWQQRLQTQTHLPFLLQVRVGGRTGPLRSQMAIGPITQTATLHSIRRIVYTPADWDSFVLDRPISLSPETEEQGYLFFPQFDNNNQLVVDFSSDRSFAVELKIDPALHSDKDVVAWNFSLISGSEGHMGTADFPKEDIPLEDIVKIIEIIIGIAQQLQP